MSGADRVQREGAAFAQPTVANSSVALALRASAAHASPSRSSRHHRSPYPPPFLNYALLVLLRRRTTLRLRPPRSQGCASWSGRTRRNSPVSVPTLEVMATSLTLSSNLTVTSHRSEVFGDISGNGDQGRCAKKYVSLANAWLGSGSLCRRHRGRSWQNQEGKKGTSLPCQALFGRNAPSDENDADDDSTDNISNSESSEAFRQRMEQMVNRDEMPFRGIDLATLIRKKYGVSYDVQFIKKEFMGRQLLAMNVMWKYREQRSFPLTEEEYLLHLDDIANNLSMWGAVGLVRDSLQKTKERPRIGKAVSIFINLDELGGRAREWIAR